MRQLNTNELTRCPQDRRVRLESKRPDITNQIFFASQCERIVAMGLMSIFFRILIEQLYTRRAAEIVGLSVMVAAMANCLCFGFDNDIACYWTNRLRIVASLGQRLVRRRDDVRDRDGRA